MKNTTRKKRVSKLCVVFDIDETILVFLNTVQSSRRFADKQGQLDYAEILMDGGGTRYVIFRPGFIEFLQYAKRHRISVAIWTYGDRNYANFIERIICEHYGFRKSPFVFVYSSAEIKEDINRGMYEKDLRRIFAAFPGRFTSSNTFLVDNKPSNIYHETNMHNGFIVESFNPFVNVKPDINTILKDRLFKLLQKICDKIMKKNRASNTPIFGKDNIQSMDLEQYYRHYVKGDKTISVLSTDSIDYDQNFTLIK